MKIDVVTIFPQMFKPVLGESIIKRAIKAGVAKIRVYNLRDFTKDKHRKVDDKPFGGSPGMVMMVQPIYDAIRALKKKHTKVILLTPQGKQFSQKIADRLSRCKHLVLICGRYEGVDERVRRTVDDEISIGDYVVTGGELPAMVLIDAVIRLLPGALGDDDSTKCESFRKGLIEYPHYTRPRIFCDMAVPEVLVSGDHKTIAQWRCDQAMVRTRERRPDLLQKNKQRR
jgi:tRNA (guanine37-N1)-methyltransferase